MVVFSTSCTKDQNVVNVGHDCCTWQESEPHSIETQKWHHGDPLGVNYRPSTLVVSWLPPIEGENNLFVNQFYKTLVDHKVLNKRN